MKYRLYRIVDYTLEGFRTHVLVEASKIVELPGSFNYRVIWAEDGLYRRLGNQEFTPLLQDRLLKEADTLEALISEIGDIALFL